MLITDSHRALVRRYGTLVARVLIGILFLQAGVSKLGSQFPAVVTTVSGAGVPSPELAVLVAILVEIVGGLALILGVYVAEAAAALAVFVLLVNGFLHNPRLWSDTNPVQQIFFMKNLAIIGALLYVVGYGAGDGWSLSKRTNDSRTSS